MRSGAAIEACDLTLEPQLAPARWLDAETCFDPARYTDGFFVLLAPDERDAAHANALASKIGTPNEVREAGGYAIWLYRSGSGALAWLAR